MFYKKVFFGWTTLSGLRRDKPLSTFTQVDTGLWNQTFKPEKNLNITYYFFLRMIYAILAQKQEDCLKRTDREFKALNTGSV